MDNINFENIKCSICEDYPRIIFEKNENKIMIKSYCYFHRDIKTYSLLGFIKKFIEKKDIEESNSNSISKDETNKLIKNIAQIIIILIQYFLKLKIYLFVIIVIVNILNLIIKFKNML